MTDPSPVTVTNEEPIAVVAVDDADTPAQTSALTLLTAGQRRINLIWEGTQAILASSVVLTTCLGIFVGRVIQASDVPFPPEWWTIVGLVIGFYFGRTNHERSSGQAR